MAYVPFITKSILELGFLLVFARTRRKEVPLCKQCAT